MKRKSYLFSYLILLSKKWWILFALIPSILGTFNFYLRLPEIIFSWQASLILFFFLFIIANYFVWEEEQKLKETLQNKLNNYEDKKPKLELTFGGSRRHILVSNGKIIRKVNSSILDKPLNKVLKLPNFAGQLLNSCMFKQELNHTEKEIHKEFVPLNFKLHNLGKVKAKNVRVDIDFPKESIILEELPAVRMLPILTNYVRKTFGIQKIGKHRVLLWDNESLHPDITEFDHLFIHFNKKGKFKLKYTINSEELPPNENKGELIIEALPKDEVRLYPGEETLRQEKEAHDILLNELEREYEDD